MRILIAEDSPTLGRDLRDALVRDGHVVDVATDGEQAMHFLTSFSYDVVTLDLMMPRIDGWAVLRQLRDRPERPRVLVLSARGQVEDRVEVLNLGADDFMVKPFAYAELLARLHALMRRAGDIVTRAELMAQVWETTFFTSSKTIDVHLGWLRRKLGDSAQAPTLITTHRGRGLRFETAAAGD